MPHSLSVGQSPVRYLSAPEPPGKGDRGDGETDGPLHNSTQTMPSGSERIFGQPLNCDQGTVQMQLPCRPGAYSRT